MRLLTGIVFSIIVLLSACQKGEKITTDPNAALSIAQSSVVFDTVFTTLGSTTKRIKLVNNNTDALQIAEIKLAGGNSSPFSININGESTANKRNVLINGRDSLNLFVKVTIDPNNKNLAFLVQDSIILNTNGNRKVIQLTAYGQNAIFVKTNTIATNTTWSSTLPYIINGNLVVKAGAQLNVTAGTKIYFHKDAGLSIEGELTVYGSTNAPILFCSDRLESIYADEPGQWRGLAIKRTGNAVINHAIIKNASVGITSDSLSLNTKPKLVLANTIIKNMQVAAYIGYHSEMMAFNNLMYNCGNYLMYAVGGGNFNLKQNTFAGYNANFPRRTAALTFSDYLSATSYNQLKLEVTNNIIWGTLSNELDIQQKTTALAQIAVNHNLIRSNLSLYNTNNNILNADPSFVNSDFGDFELTTASPALKKGSNLSADPNFTTYLSTDLKNTYRSFPSSLGCYEKK